MIKTCLIDPSFSRGFNVAAEAATHNEYFETAYIRILLRVAITQDSLICAGAIH
jgi:hypothetical protein